MNSIVKSTSNAASAFDVMLSTEAMTRVNDLAMVMAQAKVTVPKHLQNSVGDCFAVVLQSMQWKMNPFAVAQKTHLVNGVLGYEAQLVNAVITTNAPVQNRIQYEWYGDWTKVNGKEDKSFDRGVKVWATIIGENEPRVLDLSMGQVGTVRNSPMWVADPRQQIAYLAVKRWARLHTPDVILGVYTPDELGDLPEVDVTPNQNTVKPNSGTSSLKERLGKNKKAVDVTATEVDLSAYYQRIEQAQSLDELAIVAEDIKKLGLGEPAKSEIGKVYKAKEAELNAAQSMPQESVDAIVAELEAATDMGAVNTIMSTRFEPFTSKMAAAQVDAINAVYERKEAELTE